MIYSNHDRRCISCCLNICSHNGVSATKWIMCRYNPCAEYIYMMKLIHTFHLGFPSITVFYLSLDFC